MTLDEYFEQTEARKLLVKGLETHMQVFGEDLSETDKMALMRMNLTSIRQYMEDEGVE